LVFVAIHLGIAWMDFASFNNITDFLIWTYVNGEISWIPPLAIHTHTHTHHPPLLGTHMYICRQMPPHSSDTKLCVIRERKGSLSNSRNIDVIQ